MPSSSFLVVSGFIWIIVLLRYHGKAMQFRAVFFTFLLAGFLTSTALGQTAASKREQISQHTRAAQDFLHQQRPDLAIPELQKVIALDPQNVDAHGNLGVLLYFRGDYTGAVPELRAAVKLKPDLWRIQALLGLAENQLHDDVASRDDLSVTFPHLDDQKLKAEVGSSLINNYSSTGELEKAASVASTLLDAQPTDPALLFLTYQLYTDLASKTMLTLALAAPESAQMHQVMGRELARHGDDAPAIANYREAIKLDPNLAGLHFELGNLLYNSSEEKLKTEAEGEFQAALQTNPNDEKASLMLGVIAAKRGDWPSATQFDSRAISLQPDDPDACLELAKALIATNQKDKAQHLIEHAIEIDPSDYIAHYRLSTLYRQEGKREEAEKQLADYRKYKEMKDKLQGIFHDMRVKSGTTSDAEDPAAQK